MRPKAIAVDLDGTLLTTDKRISPANRDALRRCIDAGILVLPATSRPLRSSRILLQHTEICPGPGVFLGGSVAIRHDGVKCVNKSIPQDAVRFAFETVKRITPDAWVVVESDDEWYTNYEPDLSRDAADTYGVPTVLPNDRLAEKIASKMVLHWGGKSLGDVYAAIDEQFGDSLSYVVTQGEEWMEILPEDTGKERALEVLLGCSGISLDDCVAFGDGSNDVTFLAGCGRAVAMANAVPGCIAVATYVTKTNDQDGFAWAVKDYLGI